MKFQFQIDSILAYNAFALACRSTDEPGYRYALQGILLEWHDGGFYMVATDGRRLAAINPDIAISKSALDNAEIKSMRVIIDPKTIRDSLKRLSAESISWVTVHIDTDTQTAGFNWNNGMNGKRYREYSIECQFIEGRFPKWQDVLKNNMASEGRVTFDAAEWSSTLDNALDCRNDSAFRFNLNGSATLHRPAINLHFETVPDHHGVDIASVLNVEFMRDFIRSAPFKNTQLHYFGSESQIQLSSMEGRFQYVVMPISVDKSPAWKQAKQAI